MKQQAKSKQTKIGVIPEYWKKVEANENKFDFVFFIGKKRTIKFIRKPKKPFVSNGGPKGINVDKLFFEKFNEKDKIAILWHEFYHCRIDYIPKIIWLEIKYYLGNKESLWEEEYNADKYSAKNNDVEDCLSYLKISKILYDEKSVEYNPKTHPPINERIRKIWDLKNENN